MNIILMIFSMAFAVCTTTYNFIDVKPIDIYGIPLTAGFVLVACSYILSDCITELYGRKVMNTILLITICLHLVTILVIQIACILPPNKEWELNTAFVSIIGQSPKVAILSAIAFTCGTSTNAYIMSKLKTLWKEKYFKWRAFLSTIAGEFVDCCAFFPIMFYGYLPAKEIVIMILIHTLAKCTWEVSVLPITDKVVNYIKLKNNLIFNL